VPWVAWSEDVGGHHAVFVSRLVGGDHFELFNGGAPVSGEGQDAATPDITFFGNTPYVSWTATSGSETRGFVGHFADGVFVTDTPGGIRLRTGGPVGLIDARVALSSNCTADPFTSDGAGCGPAQVNAPFFTFTTAGSPQKLFAQAAIGGPNCVLFAHCAVAVHVHHGHATIVSKLRQRHAVGILVQRVTGHHRVHGRRVPTLRRVGRVPLGHHRRGTLRLPWSLKVGGKRLAPGRYQVTLRAIGAHRRVLGITKPARLRVRR
jgi:hypothetical protein